MFYNFFIPGGVGGDAYKVYILHKRFGWKVKTLTKAVFTDRLIGLIAIFGLIALLSSWLFFSEKYFLVVGIIAFLLIFFISKILLKKIFKTLSYTFNRSFWLSFIIQAFQLASIYAILKTFGLEITDYFSYFFIFLSSSVLSVVSFAGFGAREYVFLEASDFLSAKASVATGIGLMFNLITMLIALAGVIFILSKLRLRQTVAIQ